jgi:hypothetical protein
MKKSRLFVIFVGALLGMEGKKTKLTRLRAVFRLND